MTVVDLSEWEAWMGREIRRVPPNWNHPRKTFVDGPGYQPMLDQPFKAAVAEWEEGRRRWESGEDPDRAEHPDMTFAEWHGTAPHDPEYYRPWEDHEATWYQLWENVSEASPVTPPFATLEELADHLASVGEDCGDGSSSGPWGLERARAFVEAGSAPSMMVVDGVQYTSKNIPLVLKNRSR